MINAIVRWFYKDAPWYQFWMPQSGFLGGALFAVLVGAGFWLGFI